MTPARGDSTKDRLTSQLHADFDISAAGISERSAPGDDFGALLIEACQQRGMSQSQAAAHIGVARQALNDWVNGKRSPAASHVPALARFMRLPASRVTELIATPRADRVARLEYQLEVLTQYVVQLTAILEQVEARQAAARRNSQVG